MQREKPPKGADRMFQSLKKVSITLILACSMVSAQKTAKAERPDDIVVIANKSLSADSIGLSELKRIFLKQKTSLKGNHITPINAKPNSSLRVGFANRVLQMTSQEETGYWEDQKISKGTRPPAELSNTVKAIFSITNGISYCYRKDFNPAVAKILLIL